MIIRLQLQLKILLEDTVTANASDSGNGGSSVVGKYEIATGTATPVPFIGWSAGTWGSGTWGNGTSSDTLRLLRLWSQSAFGEDLVLAPRQGALYYWDASGGS
jgi:hypothetical protein